MSSAEASLTKSDDTEAGTGTVHRNYTVETPKPWTAKMPVYWPEQMPAHWRTPVNPLHKVSFTSLCVPALGQYGLAHLWEACRDEQNFKAHKDRMIERITRITVVAGLILIAMAAFVTTAPPIQHIINYNIRGPYILLFTGFDMLLGGIVVGATILYLSSDMKREWFINTLMASRPNVYCFLLLVGYPFITIVLATITMVLGILVAAWNSHDKIIRVGAIFHVLTPIIIGPIYWFSIRLSRPRNKPLAQSADGSPEVSEIEVESRPKEEV